MEVIDKEYLKNMYDDYVANFSSPDMAASYELCEYLINQCIDNDYKKIIDLGSGISSAFLRYYQSKFNDVIIYSVDDSKEWLEITKEFLVKYNLSTDNLIHDIETVKENNFDLVLHDYGRMGTRQKYLSYVISNLTNKKSKIILDDLHKNKYKTYVTKFAADNEMTLVNIPETHDKFKRYSMEICSTQIINH